MRGLLAREIDKLEDLILAEGAVVENAVRLAVQAVADRDAELARQVIDGDAEIDRMEVDVEEECLKVLALHQPVAQDLRLIVIALKINNDLERIGDLAVNIAQRAAFLASGERIDFPFNFSGMAEIAKGMLHDSLDALVSLDTELCRAVCKADDEVDAINRRTYKQVQAEILRTPEHIEALINLLGVSRRLERVADHATNIAEDVIYLVEGKIIRHNRL